MNLFKPVPSVKRHEVPKNAKIIDVREPFEYKAHHLPRTKNVPMAKLAEFESDETVYVICASGSRSKRATKKLRKRGIDAINILGGI